MSILSFISEISRPPCHKPTYQPIVYTQSTYAKYGKTREDGSQKNKKNNEKIYTIYIIISTLLGLPTIIEIYIEYYSFDSK